MKFLFVLFAVVACASAFYRPKFAFEVKSTSAKCITKVNLSADDQAKISACNFESTPGIGQYVECLYNDLGLTDDKKDVKIVNLDNTVSQFNFNTQTAYAYDGFEDCLDFTEVKKSALATYAAAFHDCVVKDPAAKDYKKNFCPTA